MFLSDTDCLPLRMKSHIGCIYSTFSMFESHPFFAFLHCAISNVSSNCLHLRIQSHIDCIYSTFPMLESHTCLTFLHCAFSVPGKNVSKSPKTQLEYQNCHQPLLLNHQCNKTYYWDDNHEFGYGSDGSNDSAKNWRHNEAVKCKCSPHTRLANDSSPQP